MKFTCEKCNGTNTAFNVIATEDHHSGVMTTTMFIWCKDCAHVHHSTSKAGVTTKFDSSLKPMTPAFR